MTRRLDYKRLEAEYPNRGKQTYRKLIPMTGLLQKNYGKVVGWNWLTARRLAERGIPAVLNLWDDGRGYYHDHSVVLVGVEEYQRARFLLVLDNWSETVSLIDYNKLCVASSLNWVEP